MPGWTLFDTHPTQGRTFQRPLDVTELSFLWDGLFNGTADNIQRFELRLSNSSRDAHLFSEANIVRAWLSTKRRYPLVGATVQGVPRRVQHRVSEAVTTAHTEVGGGSSIEDDDTRFASAEPYFTIREADLADLRPGEIVFGHVTSAEEAQQRSAAILDGPRPLSEDLLVQLYIFRETSDEDEVAVQTGTRRTKSDVLHVMTLMAHCVTDGVANNTFVRCLLDTLARGGSPGPGERSEPAQVPLEERLAMAVPSIEREPEHVLGLSPARRRWRRAVGVVIFQLRMAKRQGGHTLPCRLTRSTLRVAARSGRVSTSLTHAQSATVIVNCRLHDITFGNAYLPLAQVAMTRVLYRRYLRGDIPEEEWEYRKRQPHISGGPLNLRPYLDKAWFDRGGGGEFMLSIGLFYHHLPFMTLGTACAHRRDEHDPERVLSDGAPPFSELLTFDRFLHRSGLVKKQAAALFNHPLFFEIVGAANLARLKWTGLGALQWTKRLEAAHDDGRQGNTDDSDEEVLAVTDMPMVLSHGGSSVGNMDLISPSEYPLPPSHPLSPYSSVPHPLKAGYITPSSHPPSRSTTEADTAPKIVVEHIRVGLHTRPAELYLGASSWRGRLNMYVFYDENVFEEGVVKEWLDEVREAVLWYLGRTHQSRQEKERGGGGGRQAGLGRLGGIDAKL